MSKRKYKPLGIDDAMPYGKYKGKTIDWIIDNDPSYLQYCCDEYDLQLNNEAWGDLQVAISQNT